jgi:hypothetical protein
MPSHTRSLSSQNDLAAETVSRIAGALPAVASMASRHASRPMHRRSAAQAGNNTFTFG